MNKNIKEVITLYANKKEAEKDENAVHVSIVVLGDVFPPEVIVNGTRTFIRLPGFETVYYQVKRHFIVPFLDWED
jgi:hypothetical protein